MPSVRFTFSCHTRQDYDVIEYLDTFATTADRNVAIKAAVRAQRDEIEEGEDLVSHIGNVTESLQEDLSRVLSLLVEMRKEGIAIPQTLSISTSDGEHEVALTNIDKLING